MRRWTLAATWRTSSPDVVLLRRARHQPYIVSVEATHLRNRWPLGHHLGAAKEWLGKGQGSRWFEGREGISSITGYVVDDHPFTAI